MTDDDLAWAAEEACQNAWPSAKQIILQGWLLRASGGPIRRTNSVNPLRTGPSDPSAVIDAVEAIYARLGQPSLFRVPAIVPEMDAPLAQRGYLREGETCTLFNDFTQARKPAVDVEHTPEPSDDWIATWARLFDRAPSATPIYRTMVSLIVLPKVFAARRVDGAIVSICYGTIHDRMLVVESVATDPAHRQQGHGSQTVGSLIDWAKQNGADCSCLQVVADNTAGHALYRSLGFARELFRYHYRVKPVNG
ncbi:MAG TPA: GNAT family N-acetyltransferase [Magnetospirillaceae bacterium]